MTASNSRTETKFSLGQNRHAATKPNHDNIASQFAKRSNSHHGNSVNFIIPSYLKLFLYALLKNNVEITQFRNFEMLEGVFKQFSSLYMNLGKAIPRYILQLQIGPLLKKTFSSPTHSRKLAHEVMLTCLRWPTPVCGSDVKSARGPLVVFSWPVQSTSPDVLTL